MAGSYQEHWCPFFSVRRRHLSWHRSRKPAWGSRCCAHGTSHAARLHQRSRPQSRTTVPLNSDDEFQEPRLVDALRVPAGMHMEDGMDTAKQLRVHEKLHPHWHVDTV
eukprot:357392-Chlamydomonas_euryale.AAC.38